MGGVPCVDELSIADGQAVMPSIVCSSSTVTSSSAAASSSHIRLFSSHCLMNMGSDAIISTSCSKVRESVIVQLRFKVIIQIGCIDPMVVGILFSMTQRTPHHHIQQESDLRGRQWYVSSLHRYKGIEGRCRRSWVPLSTSQGHSRCHCSSER